MTKFPVLVVDLETTSLDPRAGAIVEVGLVRCDPGTGRVEPVLSFTCREEDKGAVDEGAWVFRHSSLSPAAVRDSLPLDAYLPALRWYFDRFPATAFNQEFDFSWLTSRGVDVPHAYFDPARLVASRLAERGRKLPGLRAGESPSVGRLTLERAWSVVFPGVEPAGEFHRALPDALMAGRLLVALLGGWSPGRGARAPEAGEGASAGSGSGLGASGGVVP